jgi:hypothetical protein
LEIDVVMVMVSRLAVVDDDDALYFLYQQNCCLVFGMVVGNMYISIAGTI